jgi:hypothetical protein
LAKSLGVTTLRYDGEIELGLVEPAGVDGGVHDD